MLALQNNKASSNKTLSSHLFASANVNALLIGGLFSCYRVAIRSAFSHSIIFFSFCKGDGEIDWILAEKIAIAETEHSPEGLVLRICNL